MKIAGRNEEIDRQFESKDRDFDLRSKPGNVKYNTKSHVIPVKGTVKISVNVGTEFKISPNVNAESQEVLPGLVNDQLSWAKIVRGVNFAGLAFVDPSSESVGRKQISMWLVPQFKSMKEFVPEFSDGKKRTPDEALRIGVNQCPYIVIWNRIRHIKSSMDSADAPDEWVALTDPQFWQNWIVKKKMGVDNPTKFALYGCPMPSPDPQALMRGYLLKDASGKEIEDFRDEEYNDGRSGGSLHPILIELGKSPTDHFITCTEEGTITPEMGELGNNTMIRLKKKKAKAGEMNSNSFELSVETSESPVITKEEVIKEWAPLRYEEKLGDSVREPILNILTVEKQIELLITALGPEIVDYGLKGSIYYDVLSKDVQGSYDKMVKGGFNWFDVTRERLIGIAPKRKQAQSTPQGPPNQSEGAPSKAPHLSGADIPIAGFDEEEAEDMEEEIPGEEPENPYYTGGEGYEDDEIDDDDDAAFLRALEEGDDSDSEETPQSAENLIMDDDGEETPF